MSESSEVLENQRWHLNRLIHQNALYYDIDVPLTSCFFVDLFFFFSSVGGASLNVLFVLSCKSFEDYLNLLRYTLLRVDFASSYL